jgi:hypothetical protein
LLGNKETTGTFAAKESDVVPQYFFWNNTYAYATTGTALVTKDVLAGNGIP